MSSPCRLPITASWSPQSHSSLHKAVASSKYLIDANIRLRRHVSRLSEQLQQVLLSAPEVLLANQTAGPELTQQALKLWHLCVAFLLGNSLRENNAVPCLAQLSNKSINTLLLLAVYESVLCPSCWMKLVPNFQTYFKTVSRWMFVHTFQPLHTDKPTTGFDIQACYSASYTLLWGSRCWNVAASHRRPLLGSLEFAVTTHLNQPCMLKKKSVNLLVEMIRYRFP